MPNNFPDWSGTWTNVKGFAGKTPWFTENWSALVDRTEDIAEVIDTATAGYTTLNDRHLAHAATTTEVVAARDGYGSLLLKEQAQDTDIATRISNVTGLISNLSGNSYRGVSFTDGIDPQDLTTLAQVNSLIVGGGSPGAIPITSLNVGTATANQKIKVDPVGTAIIGVDDVTTVTGLEVGTATANQLIRVNPVGTAIIGEDQSNLGITGFGVGSATANQLINVNSAGDGIVGISPVIFEGSVASYTVWSQSSTNTNLTTTVDKTSLFTSRYTDNCSYISDGTNDVVEITQTGFFKATLTGYCEHYVTGTGYIFMRSIINLIDPTNKAVVFNGGTQSSQVVFNLDTITGARSSNIPFSVTRIYHNTSGTLKIGAYIDCYISTTSASYRHFYIKYPTLTVTRV